MSGTKHDEKKNRLDLISPQALEQLGKVLTHGAKKYGDNNWRGGFQWSRVYGAAMRHMNAFWQREDTDKESDLPHLAHAMCCIMFLLHFYENSVDAEPDFSDMDDRPGR